MESYRCTQCWSSFDTKKKAAEHRAKGQCRRRDKPPQERFISREQADALKIVDVTGSEAQAWYRIFRLLIAGTEDLDDRQLMSKYSPCKFSFRKTQQNR